MNHLKTKLMVSAASLLLAVVMLAASSFAWFTLSTNPEITGMTATMVTNDNLEIAFVSIGDSAVLPVTGASGDFAWGNLVLFNGGGDLQTSYDEFMEEMGPLRPMTLKNGEFVIPDETIKNGRANPGTMNALTEDTSYGLGKIYRVVKVPAEEGDEEDETIVIENGMKDKTLIYGFYLDFWLRTNVQPAEGEESIPVVLTAADKRSSGGEEGDGCVFTLTIPPEPEDEDESGESGGEAGGGTDAGTDSGDDESDPLATYKMLAQNMRVAFVDVTPNIGTGVDPAAADAAPVVITFGTPTVNGDKITVKFDDPGFAHPVLNLKPNLAKLLRMYVYIDGEKLTNPDAEIPLAQIESEISVQFALQDVEMHSMDTDS